MHLLLKFSKKCTRVIRLNWSRDSVNHQHEAHATVVIGRWDTRDAVLAIFDEGCCDLVESDGSLLEAEAEFPLKAQRRGLGSSSCKGFVLPSSSVVSMASMSRRLVFWAGVPSADSAFLASSLAVGTLQSTSY